MASYTFDSIVKVRVPEYDVFIPELKTHGPVTHYMPTKIRNVVNMMERGLTVEFENKDAEMNTLALVKQFTMIANSENERMGKDLIRIPVRTQESLIRSLNIKVEKERKEVEPVNLWVNKNYTIHNIGNPPKRPKKKKTDDIPKLYEFFPEVNNPNVLPSQGYDDLSL